MPLGRKHLRRNRDAPNLGWTMQRTASNLSRTRREVIVPKQLDAGAGQPDANVVSWLFLLVLIARAMFGSIKWTERRGFGVVHAVVNRLQGL